MSGKEGALINSALVLMEPRVVLPANYSVRTEKMFRKVLAVGGDPRQFRRVVNWPQIWPPVDNWKKPSEERTSKAVMVNSNQISFMSGELYSLRRLLIHESAELDLFGRGWTDKLSSQVIKALKEFALAATSLTGVSRGAAKYWLRTPPRYLGETIDKITRMSDYKYAVVIENSLDYLSEKLFDAFFAGCVPVYVGPPVSLYGIPEGLVIQAEPSLAGVLEGMERAKSLDLTNWRKSLDAFLRNPLTKTAWSYEAVYTRILDITVQRDSPV
jgi:hypothetical protein